MQKPSTFDEALSLWDSHTALSEELGVIYVTAQAMRTRRTISDEQWPKVAAAWKRRGVTLTGDDLLKMRKAKRADARPAPEGEAAA